MLKSREAARVLENIVGPRNFSEDPAIISSYTFQFAALLLGVELSGESKDLFEKVKMGAVIMPGSTEEVRAIVKVCNRYKINFKAFSTGMGAFGTASKEGSLQVDMRRMNRIIKLDDKNMYAVVEPYVSGAEVQAELFKKGLTTHIAGSGSHCSQLAGATSFLGSGHGAMTTSFSERNLLGAEWVLPTGEVVRWGLVEDGKAGHPGPGIMGICRGRYGALGGLGIFTKAALKLYPWPGPAELEITGKNPTPGCKIPDNFKVYHLTFPSWEKCADAIYRIAEAGVAYHLWYFPLYYHAARWMGESNDDHYELWKRWEAAGIIEKSLDQVTVIIAAYSGKELDYKEKVMKDIMSETSAEELSLPGFTEHDRERFFCAQIFVTKPCTQFRSGSGEPGQALSQLQHMDAWAKVKKQLNQMQRKYIAQGILNDWGAGPGWGGPEDGQAWGHEELLLQTNPRSAECMEGVGRARDELWEYTRKEKALGTGGCAQMIGEGDKVVSKYLGNYFHYRRKIKEALDPNGVADPFLYVGRP